MRFKRIHAFTAAAAFLGMLTLGAQSVPALAAAPSWGGNSSPFVSVPSNRTYDATVRALVRAVKDNGLMVMGKINQAAILSMTGLHLEGGRSFLVGNPRVGKKLFLMNPAVGAVLPSRIYVWAERGKAYIGYFKPSALLGAINPKLAMPGKMLNKKFHKIASQAAR